MGNNFTPKARRITISIISFFIVALLVFVILGRTPADAPHSPTNHPSVNPTILPTQEPALTYTEMTLLSVGDIMFHRPQIASGYNSATQTYDFKDNFRYVKDIISSADLAVANFEGTVAESGYMETQGMIFRVPVSTLDAVKTAGFDVMAFANNHMFDNRNFGITNSLERFKEYGLHAIGATADPDTQRSCGIYEVNGIKIGAFNYTDSITPDRYDETTGDFIAHTINGLSIPSDFYNHMNIFVQGQEEAFYNRVQEDLRYFNEQGVDIVVAYLHWGAEYDLMDGETYQNKYQRQMAQKLCNMGVDVIIGSHPHVIQPMDTLTSETDPNHTTLCFYSLGNYLSNQNRSAANWSKPAPAQGYSENGLMVQLTLRKYSDGTTLISKIDYTPTWVHRYYKGWALNYTTYYYDIIPLPIAESDYEKYGLTKSSFGVTHAIEAYTRTDDVLREAVSVFNQQAVEVIALKESKA